MELDADALLSVSDFKAGEPGKVGGKEAKLVRFTATPGMNGKQAASASLWLDAKTNLPLKHVITPGKEREIVTTYTTFEIAPKVDPKDFELPK
jgi:outer membrane lipoprotein-sorting protein